MKVLKKRINIIAIMMFIIYAMMLIMDFAHSSEENKQTPQEVAQTEQTSSSMLANFETR